MITRKITREIAELKPYEIWNAFVDLIAKTEYSELNAIQSIAHLCFWYDSEVQNGGHLQFFSNRDTALIPQTLQSLASLGATCQGKILEDAFHRFNSVPRIPIEEKEEYVAKALEDEFESFDSAYYVCVPTIQELLAKYLDQNQAHFVEITTDPERDRG